MSDSYLDTKSTVVAVTEWHGALDEQATYPPKNVKYLQALRSKHWLQSLIRSPVKGFLPAVFDGPGDIVEGVISPVLTNKRWLCSLATYEEALAFSILGLPTPRAMRQAVLNRLFCSKNFLGFLFWSEAGLNALKTSGLSGSDELVAKSNVIYPAISRRPDRCAAERNIVLFSGNFFRKGGANVVDAFEKISKQHKNLVLRLCCSPEYDFNTADHELRDRYLRKIRSNPNIVMGRVSRRVILNEILPASLLYLLPTYDEAFGFAILEALAAGVPVIATREFAIPELVDNGMTGWLLDYTDKDKKRIMSGYLVKTIPDDISRRLTEDLTDRMHTALGNRDVLSLMGRRAQTVARTRFSFEERNLKLAKIYGSTE
jgi:glycosyltransferase involved in cell wall biosynthesis